MTALEWKQYSSRCYGSGRYWIEANHSGMWKIELLNPDLKHFHETLESAMQECERHANRETA